MERWPEAGAAGLLSMRTSPDIFPSGLWKKIFIASKVSYDFRLKSAMVVQYIVSRVEKGTFKENDPTPRTNRRLVQYSYSTEY
jgi:hypothetical protein